MLVLDYLMGSLLYLHSIAAMLLLHLFYVDFFPWRNICFTELALIQSFPFLSCSGLVREEREWLILVLDTAPWISDIYTRFRPRCNSNWFFHADLFLMAFRGLSAELLITNGSGNHNFRTILTWRCCVWYQEVDPCSRSLSGNHIFTSRFGTRWWFLVTK